MVNGNDEVRFMELQFEVTVDRDKEVSELTCNFNCLHLIPKPLIPL